MPSSLPSRLPSVFALLVGAASIAVSLEATAQSSNPAPPPATAPPAIAGYPDLHQDGRISLHEYAHGLALRIMRAYDTDGDGRLSPAEVAVARSKEGPRGVGLDLTNVDADGDGSISFMELRAALAAHPTVKAWFATVDADRDTYASRAELARADPSGGPKVVPQIRIRF